MKPSVTGFSPNFRTQYAEQSNLQVERELVQDLSVTVGLQWYGGHRAPVLLDTNLGPPVSYLADARPVFSSAQSTEPELQSDLLPCLQSATRFITAALWQ